MQKTPNADNKVDIGLKFEEQNRNQLTFGAGVSQFDGFFGQLSFQTSNFLGRGETFSVTAQQGNRAKNYQVAFTEPFLFDRPMTAGVDVYSREIRYEGQFTQASIGGNLVFGFQVMPYARMFVNYIPRASRGQGPQPALPGSARARRQSVPGGFAAHRRRGQADHQQDRAELRLQHRRPPDFPDRRHRATRCRWIGRASAGTRTSSIRGRKAIWYFPLGAKRRTSLGFRVQAEYIKPYASTIALPIFERLFLGGEYSMRGFDLRTVGPRDPVTGLVLGGNKSLLFNVEYLISIMGPVRLVLFYDAGQVRARGQSFSWKEPVTQLTYPGALIPDPGDFYQIPFNPFVVPLPSRNRRDRRDERVQDVDRRRNSVLHAGVERAVPADFCRQPLARRGVDQRPSAREVVEVPVRGGLDVLRSCRLLEGAVNG